LKINRGIRCPTQNEGEDEGAGTIQSQGKAERAVAENNIANEWLLDPEIFRPSKYATALKARANGKGSSHKSKDERGHSLQEMSCLKRNSRADTRSMHLYKEAENRET
jgi:hypothetical protein